MLLASKGYVRLEIILNSEVRVTPMVSAMELMHTAKAIANSVSSILNFKIKGLTEADKELAVKEYLKNKGWRIDS